MRGHRIISKISKFGNFTIRNGGTNSDNDNNKIDEKQAKDVNSRAPLAQISLNAPLSLSSSNANDKVPSKTTVNEGGNAMPKTTITKAQSATVEEKTTIAEKVVDVGNVDQQHNHQQHQLQKKFLTMRQNGENGDKKLAKIGPPASTIVPCTSEAFEIYVEDEEEKENVTESVDKAWDNAGGWDKLTEENEDAVPSSMSLWPGKENIPPFDKHEILLSFSSDTENSGANSLNSSTTKTTTDNGKGTTATTTTSSSRSTTTTKPTDSDSSKNLSQKTIGGRQIADENCIAIAADVEGRTDAGGAEVADESSELSSDLGHCPSEYMTALTHHSKKPKDEKNVAADDDRMGRFLRQLKNPMYCAYDGDIYRWHLHRERAQGRARNYMPLQSDITESMRAVLIDWCVDVVTEFELCPATFFLTVSITDRTLSRVDCPRDKLQLLGAAAVLTASKMHEIYPPTIKDIVHATDDCYTDAQVLRMEKIILKATDFSLGFPLVDTFAEFFDYFAPTPLDDVQRHMMWYLLELSTLHYSAVYRHLPSRLAAAAFLIASECLSAKTMGQKEAAQKQQQKQKNVPPVIVDENTATDLAPSAETAAGEEKEKGLLKKWEPMEQKTQIMRKELIQPVKTLLKIHRQTKAAATTAKSSVDTKLKAVRKKFSDARHGHVARMELQSAFTSQIV